MQATREYNYPVTRSKICIQRDTFLHDGKYFLTNSRFYRIHFLSFRRQLAASIVYQRSRNIRDLARFQVFAIKREIKLDL